MPYRTPAGPLVTAVEVTRDGTAAKVSATVDDDASGNAPESVGRPHAQTVRGAELYVNVPPWEGGTPIAMTAADGAFDATREIASAQIDLPNGGAERTLIYVRAQNASGVWGAVTAAWLK
jgi:carboxypeptidase T